MFPMEEQNGKVPQHSPREQIDCLFLLSHFELCLLPPFAIFWHLLSTQKTGTLASPTTCPTHEMSKYLPKLPLPFFKKKRQAFSHGPPLSLTTSHRGHSEPFGGQNRECDNCRVSSHVLRPAAGPGLPKLVFTSFSSLASPSKRPVIR